MKVFLLFLYGAFVGLSVLACFIPNLFENGFHTDKALHVFVVCVLLLWPCLCFKRWRSIFLFSGMIIAAGVSVEILQGLTPDRNPEWADLVANITGVIVGLMIGYGLRTGYRADPWYDERS